jgi:adenine-specific DNA-methyltransferase
MKEEQLVSNKMKFETPNLTAENVAKIAGLFPGVVTEGKVNFDLLRSMLGDEVYGDEAYEFTWVGKRAAIAEAGRPIRKTLRPCVEESKEWDTTENLYIEGDNLDVLKLLQESYLGKVKMIYIDPPYNTGTAMIYMNDYSQSKELWQQNTGEYDFDGNRLFQNNDSNGRFHSDWCSMMYPRLLIARNMLRDDGFAVLAMDDSEIENLKKICDEVFGEKNKIGIVTVVHKPEGRNQEKFFGTSNEFFLVYAKNKSIANFNNVIIDDEKLKEYEFADEQGKYKKKDFIRRADGKYATRQAKPNFWYPIYVSDDYKEITTVYKEGYHKVLPIIDNGVERTWKTLPETFNEMYQNGQIMAENKDGKIVIYEKMRENQVIKTHWIKKQYHAYHFGTKILDDLLQAKTFDFPKSLFLIIDTLKITTSKTDIILDFFSGSATTAHAVMQLNAEDGGKRKFIMVQLPEVCAEGTEAAKAGYKNICDIGKERIRRAGDKIKAEAGLTAQNLDIGFRVLKLDDTNMNDVYYAAGDYTQDLILQMESNIKPDRTDMDLLYGCLLDWGLPLSMPHTHEKIDGFTVHTYNDGDLIACFEEKISEKAIREIASRKPLRAVFRDSSFSSSPEKINVFEIFKLLAPNTNVRVI